MGDALAIQEGRTEKTQAFQDPKFRGSWSGYERDCLFFNAEGPKFYDAGHAFAIDFDDDGRAVAPVDVDGDGDLDLACLSLQGLKLMENRSPARNFARVRLEAVKGDPQAIGARVALKAGGVTQRDFVKATTGFATQTLLDLHFGLGTASMIDEIEVRWRDGSVDTYKQLGVNQRIVLKQGDAPMYEIVPKWTHPPRIAGRIKAPAGVSGVYKVQNAADPAAAALKGDAGSAFVFDSEGRLRRAFYRPVDDAEIALSVDHLGKGTFHADLTSVATYHLSRHEFDQADRALSRAIEMNSQFPISHYYLGILRGMQGRHAEAAESFRRALALDAYYRQALLNLGVALFHGKQLAEAAQALRETIELRDGADARHTLGQVLASAGKYDDALTEIQRAVALDAKRAEAYADLGKVLMMVGRKAEAETHLEKALELDPNLAEARELLRRVQNK
ncbi:MAG TPA: tetratricopeptide repeat protein [Planctomycetota bacterium]|nr:tetratricopeptide repeat protein [Planctomycetota bacterium]